LYLEEGMNRRRKWPSSKIQHPLMQPAAADDKIYLVMGGSEIHYYISLGWALQNVPLHKTVVPVYIFRPAFDIPMLWKECLLCALGLEP
jgi:hypothetical protein